VLRLSKLVLLFALLVGGSLTPMFIWAQELKRFRVIEFKPTAVVETKLSGEQIVYQTYHVAVAGYPEAAEADMYTCADKIFSDQFRGLADRDSKSQVWLTFYLEEVHVNGQSKARTFRIIFAKEGSGWHRLEPKNKAI
jgi:hypothetical protein